MRRIANTSELQAELRCLLAYAQTERPSRVRLANSLSALSERLASSPKLKRLPPVGVTQRWAVMDGDTQIGEIQKARSTRRSLEAWHALVNGKTIKSFYDEAESEKQGVRWAAGEIEKLKARGEWGDGKELAIQTIVRASR